MKKKILIIILVFLVLLLGIVIYLKFTDYKENENASGNILDEILSGKNNSTWQSFRYEFVIDDEIFNETNSGDMELKFSEGIVKICMLSVDDGLKYCEDLSFSYSDDNTIKISEGTYIGFYGTFEVSYENEALILSRYNNNKVSYYFKAIV